MQEERLIELLMELHLGTPRQGPGERASTHRALALCAGLPAEPDILDMGCGSGAQTLDLALATDGRITAVDVYAPQVATLERAVARHGLGDRVAAMVADMRTLALPPASFDLVWCEGAVFIMGFDQGLRAWRDLLRPGGYCAVSELCWLASDPPREAAEFLLGLYPPMRDVQGNLDAAHGLGFETAGHFTLPPRAWIEEYLEPLRARLASFREAHAGDPEALELAARIDEERDCYYRFQRFYGYEFFVFRRRD